MRKEGGLVPGVAPAAKQQGWHVAGTVKARLAGDHLHGRSPTSRGDLATIGKRAAVIDFGWIEPDRPARLVDVGDCAYLLSDRSQKPACRVAELAVDLRDGQRSARLITQGEDEDS